MSSIFSYFDPDETISGFAEDVANKLGSWFGPSNYMPAEKGSKAAERRRLGTNERALTMFIGNDNVADTFEYFRDIKKYQGIIDYVKSRLRTEMIEYRTLLKSRYGVPLRGARDMQILNAFNADFRRYYADILDEEIGVNNFTPIEDYDAPPSYGLYTSHKPSFELARNVHDANHPYRDYTKSHITDLANGGFDNMKVGGQMVPVPDRPHGTQVLRYSKGQKVNNTFGSIVSDFTGSGFYTSDPQGKHGYVPYTEEDLLDGTQDVKYLSDYYARGGRMHTASRGTPSNGSYANINPNLEGGGGGGSTEHFIPGPLNYHGEPPKPYPIQPQAQSQAQSYPQYTDMYYGDSNDSGYYDQDEDMLQSGSVGGNGGNHERADHLLYPNHQYATKNSPSGQMDNFNRDGLRHWGQNSSVRKGKGNFINESDIDVYGDGRDANGMDVYGPLPSSFSASEDGYNTGYNKVKIGPSYGKTETLLASWLAPHKLEQLRDGVEGDFGESRGGDVDGDGSFAYEPEVYKANYTPSFFQDVEHQNANYAETAFETKMMRDLNAVKTGDEHQLTPFGVSTKDANRRLLGRKDIMRRGYDGKEGSFQYRDIKNHHHNSSADDDTFGSAKERGYQKSGMGADIDVLHERSMGLQMHRSKVNRQSNYWPSPQDATTPYKY